MELWRKELYLSHHGIKGQKWGTRNYQNPDGSLTPAGKMRYGSASNSTTGYKDAVALTKRSGKISVSEGRGAARAIEAANMAEAKTLSTNLRNLKRDYKDSKRSIKEEYKNNNLTKEEKRSQIKSLKYDYADSKEATRQGYQAQIAKNEKLANDVIKKVSQKSIAAESLAGVGVGVGTAVVGGILAKNGASNVGGFLMTAGSGTALGFASAGISNHIAVEKARRNYRD